MNYIIGKASLLMFLILFLVGTLLDMGHTYDSKYGFYQKLPSFPGFLYVFMGSSSPLLLAFSFGINTGAKVQDKLISENDSLRKQNNEYRNYIKGLK